VRNTAPRFPMHESNSSMTQPDPSRSSSLLAELQKISSGQKRHPPEKLPKLGTLAELKQYGLDTPRAYVSLNPQKKTSRK
ncbi:MAG: hypothetical protein ACKPB0_00665, partial [Opitutaceae bacterium]